MKYIYLKQDETRTTAYTALKHLLNSESIAGLYRVVRYKLLKGETYKHNQIIISKVKFNHYKANGKQS